MDIIISNRSAQTIYEQIIGQVKRQIADGLLAPGEPIPSMRALARQLHISVITVQKAYELLQRDGFIETVQGKAPLYRGPAGISYWRNAFAASRSTWTRRPSPPARRIYRWIS